ncbi:hypothetical protein DOTSEDRAFT_72081 [Dothistroma septosporum NZE10]|uniref:Uncharacterized protein n=1 Tax=Dothistroma septosporum (strain NZE10 / CBS 128990) TaxID=675120 RepID=N1PLV8_DOTSN|nr:hypothetical protein DOTSEDRAFT_72081 [Dothistroma septosporum NZE10]
MLEKDRKRVEEHETKRPQLQHALDVEGEERSQLRRDNANSEQRSISLVEDNAAKLKAQAEEYQQKTAAHQGEQETLLARLQAAEKKADESAQQLEAARQARATEQE